MKRIYILTLILFCTSFNLKAEYPYEVLGSSYVDKEGTVTLIKEVTPTKAQDGVGICYGFSSTSLLESYRCRELKLDCSNTNEFLSTLDVTSNALPEKKALQVIGNAYYVLSNIEKGKNNIARESCVQFSTLLHKKFFYADSEKWGWEYLLNAWRDYKEKKDAKNKSVDCVSCVAQKIKNKMVGLKTSVEQIANALESASSEEFLSKAVIPFECLEENRLAQIPRYVTKRFPDSATLPNTEFKNTITRILKAEIPLEIGICTKLEDPTKCEYGQGHSVTLFGIKEVCKKDQCKTVVKVKNSWGESWQKSHNDGWVDLDALVESSKIFRTYENITWIEKPE